MNKELSSLQIGSPQRYLQGVSLKFEYKVLPSNPIPFPIKLKLLATARILIACFYKTTTITSLVQISVEARCLLYLNNQ